MEAQKQDTLRPSDFEKARQALEKANVPGPVTMIVNTDTWTEEQWKLFDALEWARDFMRAYEKRKIYSRKV